MKFDNHSETGDTVLKVILVVAVIIALCGIMYGSFGWHYHRVGLLNQQITQLNNELDIAKKTQTPATSSYVSQKGVRVQVYTPASNSQIDSPVIVMGEVPGNWSFEASFPVKLLDVSGQTLAQATAKLQDNWMTDKLVPFTVKLIYNSETSGTGTLVLQKDNPSGLDANNDSVAIPVKL